MNCNRCHACGGEVRMLPMRIRTSTQVGECKVCGRLKLNRSVKECKRVQSLIKSYKGPPRDPNEWIIGLEWEPQFTLLKHPKKKVEVLPENVRSPGLQKVLKRIRKAKDSVCITLPNEYVDTFVSNFEIRTPPVRFPLLERAIKGVEVVVEDIVKYIARKHGPVGVFLPSTIVGAVHKHVNLSFPEILPGVLPDCTKMFWKLSTPPTGVDTTFINNTRLHLAVPYDFCDYRGLILDMIKFMKERDVQVLMKKPMREDPIFLGYSYTGETFVWKEKLL